jgi:tetratricopeptide (TPR) repeat protein
MKKTDKIKDKVQKEAVKALIDAEDRGIVVKDKGAGNSTVFNKAFVLINSLYIVDDGTDYFSIMESDPYFYHKIRSRCDARREEDYYQAILFFENYLKINPSHSLSYHYLACTYLKLKQYDKALLNTDKAIQINPDCALFYNLRGAIYNHTNQKEEALNEYNKAISIDIAFSVAYSNRASYYYCNKQFDLAESDIVNALLYDPKNEFAYLISCYIDGDNSNYKDALAKLNKLIEIDSKNVSGFKARAGLNEFLNNYDEAIADYSSYIELSSRFNADGYYDRGMAKFRHEDFAGAIQDLAKCMEISPTTECEYHLTSAFEKKGIDMTNEELILFDYYKTLPFTTASYNEIFDNGLNIEGEERFPLP